MSVIDRGSRSARRPATVFVALTTLGACTTTSTLPDPLAAGWKGASVCERLNDDSEHRILRCTFNPGVGHERHYHDPHFGYAIEGGRMRITDENGVRSVYTSAGVVWHEVLNIGDKTVVYLIVEPK